MPWRSLALLASALVALFMDACGERGDSPLGDAAARSGTRAGAAASTLEESDGTDDGSSPTLEVTLQDQENCAFLFVRQIRTVTVTITDWEARQHRKLTFEMEGVGKVTQERAIQGMQINHDSSGHVHVSVEVAQATWIDGTNPWDCGSLEFPLVLPWDKPGKKNPLGTPAVANIGKSSDFPQVLQVKIKYPPFKESPCKLCKELLCKIHDDYGTNNFHRMKRPVCGTEETPTECFACDAPSLCGPTWDQASMCRDNRVYVIKEFVKKSFVDKVKQIAEDKANPKLRDASGPFVKDDGIVDVVIVNKPGAGEAVVGSGPGPVAREQQVRDYVRGKIQDRLAEQEQKQLASGHEGAPTRDGAAEQATQGNRKKLLRDFMKEKIQGAVDEKAVSAVDDKAAAEQSERRQWVKDYIKLQIQARKAEEERKQWVKDYIKLQIQNTVAQRPQQINDHMKKQIEQKLAEMEKKRQMNDYVGKQIKKKLTEMEEQNQQAATSVKKHTQDAAGDTKCPVKVSLSTRGDCTDAESSKIVPPACCAELRLCNERIEEVTSAYAERIEGYQSTCELLDSDLENTGGKFVFVDTARVCDPKCTDGPDLQASLPPHESLEGECVGHEKLATLQQRIAFVVAVKDAQRKCKVRDYVKQQIQDKVAKLPASRGVDAGGDAADPQQPSNLGHLGDLGLGLDLDDLGLTDSDLGDLDLDDFNLDWLDDDSLEGTEEVAEEDTDDFACETCMKLMCDSVLQFSLAEYERVKSSFCGGDGEPRFCGKQNCRPVPCGGSTISCRGDNRDEETIMMKKISVEKEIKEELVVPDEPELEVNSRTDEARKATFRCNKGSQVTGKSSIRKHGKNKLVRSQVMERICKKKTETLRGVLGDEFECVAKEAKYHFQKSGGVAPCHLSPEVWLDQFDEDGNFPRIEGENAGCNAETWALCMLPTADKQEAAVVCREGGSGYVKVAYLGCVAQEKRRDVQ